MVTPLPKAIEYDHSQILPLASILYFKTKVRLEDDISVFALERVLIQRFKATFAAGHSAYFDPKQLKDLKLSTTLRTQLVECLLEDTGHDGLG